MNRFSYIFTGLIAAASLIWTSSLFAQGVTVEIQDETSVTIDTEDYHDFHLTVHNNSLGPLSFYVLRSLNELPDDGWMSTICMDDYCYQAAVNQTDVVTVQPGAQYYVKFTVYTGNVENTGNFTLKFISSGLSGSNEFGSIDFTAQAQTSSSVPAIVEASQLPYPNPAVADLTIPLTAVKNAEQVEIFNLTGTSVASFGSETLKAGTDLRLNLADFAAGLYYYTITGNGETKNGSFSVVK